ncbi:hypothetical protein CEXT_155851 [Caerostris extrusa]|uniref:Uncharacterized protein n=1 Tax=Caerostris extrusa TaxID=172846 RepID=A0AAV4Q9R5_CAEEX|nr:hypothetical protein CEXT_155851 [Caerostris extrusa]
MWKIGNAGIPEITVEMKVSFEPPSTRPFVSRAGSRELPVRNALLNPLLHARNKLHVEIRSARHAHTPWEWDIHQLVLNPRA